MATKHDASIATYLPQTLVLPVSGQSFTNQLGIMLKVCESGYHPKLTLGASGGALVGAHGTKHHWRSEPWLKEIMQATDVSVLEKHLLGYLQCLTESSVYLRGKGLKSYLALASNGNIETYKNSELIITAYNTSLGRTEMFSTAPSGCSKVHSSSRAIALTGVSAKIHHLGDLPHHLIHKAFHEVLAATSSVPIVFNNVKIGEHYYADGGVSCSSPLNPVACITGISDVLYVNPSDIDKPVNLPQGNIIENAISYSTQVTRSNAIQERYIYLHSLCCGDFTRLNHIDGVYPDRKFYDALKLTAGRPRMVELYPTNAAAPTMVDTPTRDQYLQEIEKSRRSFGYRIFYV